MGVEDGVEGRMTPSELRGLEKLKDILMEVWKENRSPRSAASSVEIPFVVRMQDKSAALRFD